MLSDSARGDSVHNMRTKKHLKLCQKQEQYSLQKCQRINITCMNADSAIKVSVVCIVLSIVLNNNKILNNFFPVRLHDRRFVIGTNMLTVLFQSCFFFLQNENHNPAMDRTNSVSMHHHFHCIRSEIRSNDTYATRPGTS